jgi:hypothetical protein
MPKLKLVYDTEDDIPEDVRSLELYTKKDNKYVLTGVEGVKTQADIDKLNEALRKERADHTATKGKLTKFGDIDPERVPVLQSELEEAKAKIDTLTKEGKFDETKMQPLIEAAVKRATGPLEREKTQIQRDLDAARKAKEASEATIGTLKTKAKTRAIEAAIRDAAIVEKVLPAAVEDAVMLGGRVFDLEGGDEEDGSGGRIMTRDNVGVTPGLSPKEWLKDMQEKRAHWWAQSQGGGSQGGRGSPGNRADNPWSAEGWNISAQGAYYKTHGAEKAAAAAKAAGSAIGNTKPPQQRHAA